MSKYAGMNNAKITSEQCAKLLFLFALGSSALILPTTVTMIARQDGWLSMLLVGPVNYFVLMIYLALADRFPNMSPAHYVEKLIGVWGGKALTLLYCLFFLMTGALVLRNISDFMSLSVLQQTPEWFIDATFMIVVIYGALLGIETIARTGEILFSWCALVITILLFSLFNQFDFHNFEPFLYDGWERPIKGIYPVLGFPIGEFVFITLLLPQVRQEDRKKLRKSLKLSVAMITFISVLITGFLVGVMGVSEASRSPFAIYDMAKNINIQEILVRVEILVAMVWIATVFIKLALCVYVLSLITAQMLKLSTYRPLVIPYSFLVVPLSLAVYRNAAQAREFAMGVWTIYSLLHGIIFPMLLLLIAMIRGKKDTGDGSAPESKMLKKSKQKKQQPVEDKSSLTDKEPSTA